MEIPCNMEVWKSPAIYPDNNNEREGDARSVIMQMNQTRSGIR